MGNNNFFFICYFFVRLLYKWKNTINIAYDKEYFSLSSGRTCH